jgi:hypothetical protein
MMSGNGMIQKHQERPYSAHHLLRDTAFRANEVAQKREPGWWFPALHAQVFSVLAIEAFCNTVGEKIIEDWRDYESASITAKLRTICGHLGIAYSREVEPWSAVRQMIAFRNLVAHAKPEDLVEDKVLTREQAEEQQFDRPESKLEKQLTLGNTARALKTCQDIIDIIQKPLDPETLYGISHDGCYSMSKLIPGD